MTAPAAPRLVCVGEAVVDRHADGRAVVGGAALNVAVHAAALLGPGKVALVTRVGDDDAGRAVRALLAERGVDGTGVQVDAQVPTGCVEISGPADAPVYRPAALAAWRDLDVADAAGVLEAADAACWGGLLLTAPDVAGRLHERLARSPAPLRLLDPNLRTPLPSATTLRAALRAATHLKVAAEELPALAGILGDPAAPQVQAVAHLAASFELAAIAVTRGRHGASLFTPGLRRDAAPPPVAPAHDADAVGAGDAWNAGLLAGLLEELPGDVALARANACGAAIAARAGATAPLPTPLPA